MIFFLGTHHPHWLARLDVPLFVSRRSLARLRTLPRARGEWALDSGGFTELSLHGRWAIGARDYAGEVRRFRDEIGEIRFASPMDWMTEDHLLRKTGLSVAEHQRRTVENLLELRSVAPDLPFIPVLQGWTEGQYMDCVDLYAAAGIDLWKEPLVGVGSICRRQSTLRAHLMLRGLAHDGLKIHTFGLKKRGIRACGDVLASADSLAWSLNARRSPPLPGHAHASCANCLEWALLWRDELLASLRAAA